MRLILKGSSAGHLQERGKTNEELNPFDDDLGSDLDGPKFILSPCLASARDAKPVIVNCLHLLGGWNTALPDDTNG